MAQFASGIKDTDVRIYSGNGFFVTLRQLGEIPSLPLTEPRPTTTIQPDGGKMTDWAVTFIDNETIPFEPVEFTIRLMHLPEYLAFVNSVGNPRRVSPWEIFGDTWTGFATNAIGTRQNSTGEDIACLVPADYQQRTRMIQMVVKTGSPADAASGEDFYHSVKGVVVSNAMHQPDGPNMYVEYTCQCWGAIETDLTDWPTGIESTP